jgi:hypothetical protein
MSVVEQILRKDSSGIYAHMDFYTRDSYRHAVEKIAKKSALPENEVADIVIGLAKEGGTMYEEKRKKHVGYYLSGRGLRYNRKGF